MCFCWCVTEIDDKMHGAMTQVNVIRFAQYTEYFLPRVANIRF